MSRLRGGDRRFNRFQVSQFADENDVRVLPQIALERGPECEADFLVHLHLVNAVEVYKTPWGTLTSVVDDFIDVESALLMDSE